MVLRGALAYELECTVYTSAPTESGRLAVRSVSGGRSGSLRHTACPGTWIGSPSQHPHSIEWHEEHALVEHAVAHPADEHQADEARHLDPSQSRCRGR